MDRERYGIRAFRPSDYPEEARVWTLLDPGVVYSPFELRRQDEAWYQPPLVQVKVVAEDRSRGLAVGFGYLFNDPESFDPVTFWAEVGVDPGHQSQGLGLALAGAIHGEAERRRARRLWANVRTDDARAVRFLALQGYAERRRTWRSRLDLAAATNLPDRSEELSRQGISFTTLAEEGPTRADVRRKLYDLLVATSADEPRLGPYTPISFEQFLEMELGGSSLLPGAYFLAREGERFVALCSLRRATGETGTLQQGFTGTRREFRGRGVASELKRRAVEYGRQQGYRDIRTGNDSLNRPMLAINRKLGFRPEREQILAERLLGD